MIYVFLANGTEEVEAITVVDVLRRAGKKVQMVGVGGKTVTGSHGITIVCDIEENEAIAQHMEMLVLPGGMPGTTRLEESTKVLELIDYAITNDVWIAAICAAPRILGRRGLLAGRKATCFQGFEDDLTGACVSSQPVCVDGKLITSRGMGVALEFAIKLAEVIVDSATAKSLADSLQCAR